MVSVGALRPEVAGGDGSSPESNVYTRQRLLDTGDYGSIAELADSESLNRSYVSRILRLTLLAPDIVEAILDGRQSEQLTLKAILEPFTAEWARQRELLVS